MFEIMNSCSNKVEKKGSSLLLGVSAAKSLTQSLLFISCLVCNYSCSAFTFPSKINSFSSNVVFKNSIGRRFHNCNSGQGWVLNGINEWRDTTFSSSNNGNTMDMNNVGILNSDEPLKREICVLPFPYEDVILQGETKQLRLYEDRFIKLFDKCQTEHHGMFCMGLLTEGSGIVQTAALCEIEDFNRSNEFGIFTTIRVVGRIKLLELTQMEPYICGICSEVIDEVPPSLDLPNMVADGIQSLVSELSMLELRLYQAKIWKESEKRKLDEPITESEEDDIDMRQKIVQAALDGSLNYEGQEKFSCDSSIVDSAGNKLDIDDIDCSKKFFDQAYLDAFQSDSQGFVVSTHSNSNTERSAKELAAISWAAFVTGDIKLTERIQALDCDNLFDRLKLGAHALREKKNMLAAKLAISDLDSSNQNFESDREDKDN